MKKLIALISAIAVMGTMSLTSLAAIEVTPNAEATGAALAKNATSGYDASYTSDKVNTQTTILAVKGAEITTTSIQYINQLAQDSETAINFDLKDALAVGDVVNVYMGGDAINKTLVGKIEYAADPVEKFTVKFVSEGATLSEVAYDKDAAIVVPENPTKAADASYTYAFAGWYVEGDAEQTVVDLTDAKATANVTYVAKFTATPIQSGGEAAYTVSGTVTNSVTADFFEADFAEILAEIYEGDDAGYQEAYEELSNLYGTDVYLYEKSTESLEAFANYYIGEIDELPAPAYNGTVNPATSEFAIENVASGDYLVVIWRQGTLPYLDYVNVSDADVTLENEVTLFLGDTDSTRDGVVDYIDAYAVLDNIKGLDEDGFIPTYDIETDCVVDYLDAYAVLDNISDIYAYETEATADLEELELI